MVDIATISSTLFSGNYVFVIHDSASAVVVDPGDDHVCFDFLNDRRLNLVGIFITHHHYDHIAGVNSLKKAFPDVKVYGSDIEPDVGILCTEFVHEGSRFKMLNLDVQVIATPGHTMGHICFYVPELISLFCGDTLFNLGCGNVMEGSPKLMFESLQKLKQLPKDTKVFCAHEYAEKNAMFVEKYCSIEDSTYQYIKDVRAKRAENMSTVPSTIAKEILSNPFLKATSLEDFSRLRSLRNHF
ncbi:MAG: hydroxyacylglutathione hydrolase [Proteobacteria bacterium]|nr:hydroxyacylglutathione hydrolase [Pseudomonadota bacterium]